MIGNKEWIKCPICSSIYGKMLGDMPDGKMAVNVDSKMECKGYPMGTIIINYGTRMQIQYPSTFGETRSVVVEKYSSRTNLEICVKNNQIKTWETLNGLSSLTRTKSKF